MLAPLVARVCCLFNSCSLDQKGISKSFLDYFHSLDSTVGQKALGHDQTLSAKLQEQLQHAAEKARAIDEQKGLSKSAHDVRNSVLYST